MKKINFLWIALVLITGGCNTDSLETEPNYPKTEENPYFVDIQQAIDIADQFFSNIEGEPGTRTPKVVKNIEVYKNGNVFTRSSDTNPVFYLINYMNDGGFALISTDSRKLPVYAFSTEGHMSFSDTLHNEGLRNYLHETSDWSPIFPGDTTRFDPINPNPSIPSYNPVSILVPPMLDTNPRYWDQLSLNKYVCSNPKDSIPVGCVALATAQIMSYYRWPNRWPIDGFASAKEKYNFNWTEMLKTRVNDPTARLLEILGRPEYLNITYKKGGSSTTMNKVAPTMEKMGFKLPRRIKFHTDSAVNELFKRTPIIMDGFPPAGGSGHAWTVDGLAQYKLLDVYHLYFHFIWGNWGGSNGYFYYDESKTSFDDHAQFFDENEHGHGDIHNRWGNISIMVNVNIDTDKIN